MVADRKPLLTDEEIGGHAKFFLGMMGVYSYKQGAEEARSIYEADRTKLLDRIADLSTALRTYLTDCGCGIPKPSDCDEIIKWINSDRQNLSDCCLGCREAARLMVPPIPLPKGGE